MTLRCLECGAFMNNIHEGYTRSWWQCPNCKREISLTYKEVIGKKVYDEKDEFI